MDQDDVRVGHLRRARELILALEPIVEMSRTGDANEAMRDSLGLIARSAVVRQTDALAYAIRAVEDESANNVAALVRPAVEELITLSYLVTLGRDDANAFVLIKMRLDLGEALDAQNRLFVDPADSAGRIEPMNSSLRAAARSDMVALARRYDWPVRGKGDRATSYGPTMGWMAEKISRRDLYDYLYGAASRLVHFSPTELLRRCWFDGNSRLTIGGQSLERWWASFALGWGSVLLAETVAVTLDVGALNVEHTAPPGDLDALITECKSNIPPLVTLGELNLDPRQRPRPRS